MQVKPIKMRWPHGANYCYLLTSADHSWLIDPAQPDEVLAALSHHEIATIEAIVNTHHHHDHAGGNRAVLDRLRQHGCAGVRVIGSSAQCAATTEVPAHRQEFLLGDAVVTAIRTPCHTQDSVCYHARSPAGDRALFTGDTLFTAGCGRFFEGSAAQMHAALQDALLATVGESHWAATRVYPGHEYTLSNVQFARAHVFRAGDNAAFDALEAQVRGKECTTGCFTLADETRFNPFLLLDTPAVRAAVGDPHRRWPAARVMDALRRLKNSH